MECDTNDQIMMSIDMEDRGLMIRSLLNYLEQILISNYKIR